MSNHANEQIKAISVNQPWAWLMAAGHKPIENRSWKTKPKGLIYFHAGKKVDRSGYAFAKEMGIDVPDNLPTGGIVGQAHFIDCVTKHDSPWFFGPYGFVMISPSEIDFMRCKGHLGFFTPDLNSRYKGDER